MNEEYYITDIETGYQSQVTEKVYKEYKEWMEKVKPSFDGRITGVIYGTSCEIDQNDYKEFFNKINNTK